MYSFINLSKTSFPICYIHAKIQCLHAAFLLKIIQKAVAIRLMKGQKRASRSNLGDHPPLPPEVILSLGRKEAQQDRKGIKVWDSGATSNIITFFKMALAYCFLFVSLTEVTFKE